MRSQAGRLRTIVAATNEYCNNALASVASFGPAAKLPRCTLGPGMTAPTHSTLFDRVSAPPKGQSR